MAGLQLADAQAAQTAPGFNLANAAQAATTSAPVTINPGQTINPGTLNLAQPDSSTKAADGMIAGLSAATDNYTALLAPTDAQSTADQTQYNDISSKINTLIGQDANKGAEQVSAETAAGLPDLKSQLANLNGQITTGIADYNAAFNDLENRPQQLASVVGSKQQELQRTKAADLGLLNARAQALQGNITAAQDNVNRAIDLKYSSIENELNARQNQLQSIQGQLSADQKKRSDALSLAIQDQQQKIADEKAKTKDNLNLALTAAVATKFVNNNGEFFNTATGQTYATPADFYKAAGVTSFDQAYQKGLITDLTPAKVADINTVLQAAAKYPDAGIKSTDSLDVVKQKLQSSPSYHKDTYIAPPAGSTTNGLQVSPVLAAAINAGTIDPNKINSRTLGIYESIAQAGVDAVGSHAGAAGETKAVQDLVAYKSVATRTLGVIDKNLPLVADLADKVNKTGIPGLDQYLQGAKAYTGNNQDVVKYVNSLKTLRSEYAQMLAKGASATESDKAEAAQAIPSGLSGAAYNALGEQLKLEAQNILQASDEAISAAKDKSSSNNSTQSQFSVKAPDGNVYNFNSQSDLDSFKSAANIK